MGGAHPARVPMVAYYAGPRGSNHRALRRPPARERGKRPGSSAMIRREATRRAGGAVPRPLPSPSAFRRSAVLAALGIAACAQLAMCPSGPTPPTTSAACSRARWSRSRRRVLADSLKTPAATARTARAPARAWRQSLRAAVFVVIFCCGRA